MDVATLQLSELLDDLSLGGAAKVPDAAPVTYLYHRQEINDNILNGVQFTGTTGAKPENGGTMVGGAPVDDLSDL